MKTQVAQRWSGEEVVARGVPALLAYLNDGVRIVVIEGLPGAGKSTLLGALRETGATAIDLDDFISVPADEKIAWTDHVVDGGGRTAVQSVLDRGVPQFVGGAAVWPILSDIVEAHRLHFVRVYLKSVYVTGDFVWWDDGDGLLQHAANSSEYFKVIYEHHGRDRPWLSANLVIERMRV